MKFPNHLKYTKDHEWALIEGNQVTVGITDHAQNSLGDVVYVELPAVGTELKKGDSLGVVESIKAVSDLYSPVTGKVVATNSALPQQPGDVNLDPYGKAWMIKIELTDSSSIADLMDATTYEAHVKENG